MNRPEKDSIGNLVEPQEFSSAVLPGEIILGTIVGFDSQMQPQVDYSANPYNQPQSAVSTVSVTRQHLHRQAALLFANGDPRHPVIIGLIHNPLDEMLETFEVRSVAGAETVAEQTASPTANDVTIDGKRIVIEGREEIVFKCGDASITLTKAGKILIRGKYLMNRSSGVNRIMGGSVQVN
jgi:hypothetical protein